MLGIIFIYVNQFWENSPLSDVKLQNGTLNERVLLVGAGPSGMDLAHMISKQAKQVTLSHHLHQKPRTKFLCNVNQKPDVKELLSSGAIFRDETYDGFSALLFCTGYQYTFPFLSMDCGIYVDDNFVQPLYKHCLNIINPTMTFIGIPFYVCASQMMDIQSRFILKFLTGKKRFPCITLMYYDLNNETERRLRSGYSKRQAHMMGPEQIKYYKDLSKIADIQNIQPVMSKLHYESSQRFLDDLVNFRKDIFTIIDNETFVKIN